ncbi:hypothetical protein [Herbaspirillum sp. B65]|uniref:hypothetical protein n=1 Tax=Herbaspirillum sp. B65 TaxID=137708 RepID=UPI0005C96939|nr:hypothetical protein [Herbaspirillum sp. B65]
MSANAWRIFTTVIKEFWLPSVLAAGFALWGVSGDELRKFQGYFFGFLMLAWFTGQIVRIKREIERKDSVKDTIDRFTTLSEKLDVQLRMITGHATGGDSYIKVYPHVDSDSGNINFAARVEGDFAIRSVDIVVQDIDAVEPWRTAIRVHEEIIWPGTLRALIPWLANGQDRCRCLIQLSALNHTAICEAVVERDRDGKFVVASKQRVGNKPWEYSIPAHFPGHDASRPESLFKFEMELT